MAEPVANQHKGRVAIRECAYHPGAADLLVELFNDIVGADSCPMFAGEVAVLSAELPLLWPFHGRIFCSPRRGSPKFARHNF